jgi:transposase
MGKRQFQLTAEEQQVFQAAERQTRDAYELRRLQAVRLYGSGMATSEITALVPCAARRIREWSQKDRAEGLRGLKSKWQGENALKLSRAQRADLKSRLADYRPDEGRVNRGQFWTVSDVAIVVEQWYGVRYQTTSSYHGLLHECGLS